MSPDEVVGRIRDGMTIGIGGWGSRRKPMALVRAICRSPLRDLTVVSYGGPDVGMLVASGKVRRLVYAFVSLESIPLDPHFRTARESGAVEVSEYDEGMLRWGLYAAALGLPFLPTRAGIGSGVMTVNPDLRTVVSPYEDGETLVAMPAISLDVSLLHANLATPDGVIQVAQDRDPFFDRLFALAAAETYVTCEQTVDLKQLGEAGCVHSIVTDPGSVDGIVEIPGGAHPTSCEPAYGIDERHLEEYVAARGDGWREYAARYIALDDHEAYLAVVRQGERE